MRVVRFTAPLTHPDNCLNIIFASRTFLISKLPHKVGTFRRMGQQESDTLYRTHVSILVGLMQPLTAEGFLTYSTCTRKITNTFFLPPSLVAGTLPPFSFTSSPPSNSPPLHSPLYSLPTSLTHPSLLTPHSPSPLSPSSLNPPIDPFH